MYWATRPIAKNLYFFCKTFSCWSESQNRGYLYTYVPIQDLLTFYLNEIFYKLFCLLFFIFPQITAVICNRKEKLDFTKFAFPCLCHIVNTYLFYYLKRHSSYRYRGHNLYYEYLSRMILSYNEILFLFYKNILHIFLCIRSNSSIYVQNLYMSLSYRQW